MNIAVFADADATEHCTLVTHEARHHSKITE